MKNGKRKMMRPGISFYLSVIAACAIVISLGVSYGYALRVSGAAGVPDLTGVTYLKGYSHADAILVGDPLVTGVFKDNSGHLDSNTGQGKPLKPRARAYVTVWGKAHELADSNSGQGDQLRPRSRPYVTTWGSARGF